MTFDTRGHTMMGVTPEQAVEALVAWGADAVGGNCGNGPDELLPVIERMHAADPDAVLVAKSNAGMPELVDMRAVYKADPRHDGRLRDPVPRRGRHDRRRLLRQHARPPARDGGRAPSRQPRTDGVRSPWPPARSRSASSSPRSSARSAGRRSSTWSGRSRTSATTRSGSASTSSIDGPIDRRAARGRRGPRWRPSRRRRPAWSSGRSSRARTSTTRRSSPSRRPRSTRSAAAASILGLGAGWNETEFRAFGFPFDHRIDRFEEAFTIIRTLLRDGAIDFDGPVLPGPRLRAAAARAAAGRTAADDRLARPADAAHHAAARRLVERVVRRHRQLAPPACRRCATSSTRPAATSVAIRPRWSGPWRSRSVCRAARAASRADYAQGRATAAGGGRRTRWPRSCAPTPARGSGTSSS